MKYALQGLVLLGLSIAPVAARAHDAPEYRISNLDTDAPSPELRRTRITISAGSSALDTFDVLRIRQPGLRGASDPPVMLISPFGFQSEFWEITTQQYNDSFAARVALAGYDVWLVDSRTADLAPGSCESGAVDCSPLSHWGIDAGIEDALFVQRLVRFAHPFQKPVIGGLSGGSSTAIASVDREPQLFAGLFMWEGTLFTADPAIRARNAAFCQQDDAALAAGNIVDPSSQGFKVLLGLAQSAPNDPSPFPGFPPGTTNMQAVVFALSLPNPANPLNFTEGFIRLVGDPGAGTFTYADVGRVFLFGDQIANYSPVRFLRDSHCAMAGIETGYTDRLSKFRGDVLVYAAGLGFGQMMVDTANLMRRAHVTLEYRAEYGESDLYFSHDWVTDTVDPLLRWLRGVRCD